MPFGHGTDTGFRREAPDMRAQRTQHMRDTLTKWGYNVARKGDTTPRLMHAWNHFQQNLHQPHRGARSWNSTPMGQHGGPLGLDLIKDAHGNVVGHTNTAGAGRRAAHNVAADVGGARGGGGRHPGGHGGGHGGGGGAGGGGGGGGVDPGADPSMFPGVPGVDAGNTNTNKLLGRDMADTLAGYQFDPQIQELLTQIQQSGRDTAQHQHDIGHWYDQVEGAQQTAGTRDTEAADHAHSVTTQALQGILQSLGGSRGAGVVGAAGLNDLTELASQGESQSRYNADLAPLLKNEAAGAHSREAALGSQRSTALNTALVSARGQRGQAKSKALMDIIQANNQGRQGNFQNRLAVQNAKLAAASLGLNADQTYAGIDAQKANTQINKAKLALESLAFQQKSGTPNWAKLNYPDRQTVVHDAVGRAAATMAPDHWDDAYVRDRALKLIRAGGYSSARGRNWSGKVNKHSQRQIQAAVNAAVSAAYQAWKAKQR